MGRLQPEFLARIESFCDRALDVADFMQGRSRSPRVVEQLVGCGSSVGANLFEADEAMSRKDFCRCISISIKELNEVRFWLRLAKRRGWVEPERLAPLELEADELKRILGTIRARSQTKRRTSID